MRTDHAEAVAAKLIEQLQQGTAPWQKPWAPGEQRLPYNPTTGKAYRGVNSMWLEMQGRGDPRWMTYKQAAAEGAQVRKGEKGTRVEYWKFRDERQATDAAGNPIIGPDGKPKMETVQLERPRMFAATVFNADQIDGLPPREARPVPPEHERHERAEAILSASGAKITHSPGNRAFYSVPNDAITLPERHQFHTTDGYYATALHELGHWTGHSTRLDRDLSHPFGSEGYAREELRAEIASLMLGDELGIGHDPGQHAAYVGSWIKALKDDPREIFRAASDAEKINSYVLGLEKEREQSAAIDAPAVQLAPGIASAEVAAELDRLHADAVPGYSVRESWAMMQAEAAKQGYEARIDFMPEGSDPFDGTFLVSYLDPRGEQSGITTTIYGGDGKMFTSVDGVRMSAHISNDDESQPATLSAALDDHLEGVLREDGQQIESMLDAQTMHGDGYRIYHFHEMDERPLLVTDIEQLRDSAAPELYLAIAPPPGIEAAQDVAPPARRAMTEPEAIVYGNVGAASLNADRWDDDRASARVQGIATFARESLEAGNPAAALAGLREASGIERRFGPPYLFREAADALEAGQLTTLQDLIDSREAHFDAEQVARDAYLESINTREVPTIPPPAWQAPGGLSGQLAQDWARFTEFEQEVADLRADAGAAEYYVEATEGLSDAERGAAGIQITHQEAIRDMQTAGAELAEKVHDFERFREMKGVLLPEEKAAKERRDREAAAATTPQTDALVRMPVLHEAPEAPMQGRTYLAVPFAEKDEAKAMGAKWDKEAKAWYAPEGVSIEASGLDRWAAGGDGVIASQTTADPRVEFARALREAGLQVEGLPVMDGQMQRVPVEGDRRGERSGAYAGHMTGQTPGGYIKNHKTGVEVNWKSSTVQSTLGAQQRATLNAEAAMRRQQRMDQREDQQERAAQLANSFFNEADTADSSNAYAAKKDIGVAGLRQVPPAETGIAAAGIHIAKTPGEAKKLREANPDDKVFLAGDLLVPARDFDGKMWSLQSVNPIFKSFMKGGRKHGLHALAGTDKPFAQSELATNPALPLIVAEGYATADTLAGALGHPVVVAFDSGNLHAVAEQLRERFPERPILIAGDNDHAREGQIDEQTGKPKANVGKEKAIEAAAAVRGATLLPPFVQGEQGSDWNDRAKLHGVASVKQELLGAIAVASVQTAAMAQAKAEEARKQEQTIRRDPKTTDAEKVTAKEDRKAAEAKAMAAEKKQPAPKPRRSQGVSL